MVINYDFKDMTDLQMIRIWNGFTKREELTNLRKEVKFKNM